jgi:alkylation response protein AidB-like acyl-CoA dehydrogenase
MRTHSPIAAGTIERRPRRPVTDRLTAQTRTVGIEEFADACDLATQWPRPCAGQTLRRFALLARDAYQDLVLGRLVEAHADAVAISTELGAGDQIQPGQCWGVWAAGPANNLRATRSDSGWQLEGEKQWCSGATLVSHALVDAAAEDGQRLFAVRLATPGVRVQPVSWVGPGMSRSETRTVTFESAVATPIGDPGDYLERRGFWAGAIGVAACWHGGTVRIAEALFKAGRTSTDAHVMSHLGATQTALFENRSVLAAAASALDSETGDGFAVLARSVRTTVEQNATEVIDRVGRALGPRPLAHDRIHAETVADLTVYIRQHHAERDLEQLGRDVANTTAWIDGIPWEAR